MRAFSDREHTLIAGMLRGEVNSPVTSSAGRLFDAVASLVDLRQKTRYEGQAAMELEFATHGLSVGESYPVEVQRPPGFTTRWPKRSSLSPSWWARSGYFLPAGVFKTSISRKEPSPGWKRRISSLTGTSEFRPTTAASLWDSSPPRRLCAKKNGGDNDVSSGSGQSG